MYISARIKHSLEQDAYLWILKTINKNECDSGLCVKYEELELLVDFLLTSLDTVKFRCREVSWHEI